ncbi:autotransporter outer membrane beta-barrel domain-containing protein [Parendozoicomonas sp. Alg238-R29]|uniref:autotransporter family protein n=1 Tax=Parendozoicomonas sp. Alg238-R29 TaxID=2993446 RepID=UPI00248D8E26|nr:autotransporter outer membrane beta-barrel domain-containing protein [Parendozoicomonas sp. Alg238-R29]
MNRSFVSCMLPLCAAIQASGALAEECQGTINGSCSITSPKSGKGPLYTVPAGTSGTVDVTSSVSAKTRNEAFLITGKNPSFNLNIKEGGTVDAEYTALHLEPDSSAGTANVLGTLSSEFGDAAKVSAKATYLLAVDGKVQTQSEFLPAISIDGSASGTLSTDGKIIGQQGGAILYTSTPDLLKNDAPGSHTLTIRKNSTVSATDLFDGAIRFGSPANINIASALPKYQFSTIVIDGTVSGSKTGIALVHGELTSSDPAGKLSIELGENSRVTGQDTGIRLGKAVDGTSYARFDGQIIIKGTVEGGKTAISGAGDITAKLVNQGTITALTPSAIAVDFSQATNVLTYRQEKGSTLGGILGNTENRAVVEIDGGTVRGRLANIDSVSVSNGAELHLTQPLSANTLSVDGKIGLNLDTTSSPSSPYVTTTGNLTLGATSEVALSVPNPKLDTPYTLFTAGTFSGEPAMLTSNNMMVNTSTSTPASNQYAAIFSLKSDQELDQQFRKYRISRNQSAAVMNSVKYAPSAMQELVMKAGNNPSTIEVLSRELTPATQTSSATLQNSAQNVATRVNTRLSSTGVSTGDGADTVQGFWAQLHADDSDQDKNKDDLGYDGDQKGITVGFDTRLRDSDETIGIAFTAVDSEVKYKKSRNRLNSDLHMLTFYRNMFTEYGELRGQFSYGYANSESSRYVNSVKHKAKYDSSLLNIQVLLKNAELLCDTVPLAVVGGINVTYADTESYKFKGPYLDERIKDADATAFELGAGVEYVSQVLPNHIQPHASVMGWYDLKDDKLDTRYTIGTSPTIKVKAPDKGRFTLTGQVGLDYLHNNLTYTADVTGIWRDGFTDVGFIGRIRYEF